MKKCLILLMFLAGMYSCSQSKEDLIPANVAHSGAKQSPIDVSVEDWGGLTMTMVSIDSSNKAARDTTWGTVWAGVPVWFHHMSYEYSRTYAVAWGEFANTQQLHDMSVSSYGVDSDGMFNVTQLTTGPSDPYFADQAAFRVASDVRDAIGDISWFDGAHYFGTIRPGVRQDMIDALNDLKDGYETQAEDNAAISEMNDWINNMNSSRVNSSVSRTIDEFSVLIMGRIVKKPDGKYGIVPPLWVPPVG